MISTKRRGIFMQAAKIFKKLQDQKYIFRLVPYDFERSNYSELIKQQKCEGYRQVLFNTELMLEIIKATYSYASIYIVKINMSEDATEDVQREIDGLVLETRNNKEKIFKVIEELEWYSDSESIDISEILIAEIGSVGEVIIKSNGIFIGEEMNRLFEIFVSLQLERYFDEE